MAELRVVAGGGEDDDPIPVAGHVRDDDYVNRALRGIVAHPARVYDYLLGGRDNFAVDRVAAEAMLAPIPSGRAMVRANREFLVRAVSFAVDELGVTQFLDIGSGLPTRRNVHQVAQEVDPSARVLYVDRDPVVAAHSRALLSATTPLGRTSFLMADATDPDAILDAIRTDPDLAATIDLTRPVALMLVSVLMYFDDPTVHRIVRTLVDALPPGSCLTISHPTADFAPEAVATAVAAGRAAGLTYIPRSLAQVQALFDGLDPVEPGVVALPSWRPDRRHPAEPAGPGSAPARLTARTETAGPDPHSVYFYGGMARTR